MAKTPAFFVTKTLLAGVPDTNRRTIYDATDKPVCVFNQDMEQWTAEHERRLQIVLKALLESTERS